MKATTVKIEGELLKEIESVKPSKQSVSSYVRSILRKSLDRERARHAAHRYAAFINDNPEEADWLAAWARADLATPVARESES